MLKALMKDETLILHKTEHLQDFLVRGKMIISYFMKLLFHEIK